MARYTFEGRTKITWIPYDDENEVDLAAPTVAEITTGKDFTAYLPTAGVGISHTQNMASLPMIDQRQVASQPGSETAEGTLTFVLDDEFDDDDPFVFFSHGDEGYIVRALAGYSGTNGAPAAGDKVAVYRATAGNPQPTQPAQDEFAQVDIPFGFTEWDVHGAVVAGE